MKYVDASAVLRVLFVEPGPSVPLLAGDHVVSSRLVEVEACRAVDRERLLGNLGDVVFDHCSQGRRPEGLRIWRGSVPPCR